MEKPKLEERAGEPYAAIRVRANGEAEFRAACDTDFPGIFGRLAQAELAPAAPPFIRTYESAPDGFPSDFEIGVPVAGRADLGDDVTFEELPAGRWAVLVHVGPYTHDEVRDLNDARGDLLGWVRGEGLEPAASIDRFLVDASRETDWTKWETELAFLLQ